ncbi:MAG: hypothetical protein ACI9VR_000367 [Cognaticolwellia sp.]|jgi:hypothetical protein
MESPLRRRDLLAAAGATLLLAPVPALAKKEEDPKLLLELGGTLSHRGQVVTRDKVHLRVAFFDDGMGRKVIWEQFPKVDCVKGVFSVTLKKLGTQSAPALPDTAHMELWVMDAGPHVRGVRLTPRLGVDFGGTGSADCLDVREAESELDALDAGGSCTFIGDGALRVDITTLQLVLKN